MDDDFFDDEPELSEVESVLISGELFRKVFDSRKMIRNSGTGVRPLQLVLYVDFRSRYEISVLPP